MRWRRGQGIAGWMWK
jgi:hypothetical protein